MSRIKKLFVVLLAMVLLCGGAVKLVKTLYPLEHEQLVATYAKEYSLSEHFVYGIIKTESNFKRNATSHKDARGLMQIMVPTGEWIASQMHITDFRPESLHDPETNIKMGCYYIRFLLDKYHGDKTCALAAYNAGYANVDSWLLNKEYSKDGKTLTHIPFPETEQYVKQVLKNEEIYAFVYKQSQ